LMFTEFQFKFKTTLLPLKATVCMSKL